MTRFLTSLALAGFAFLAVAPAASAMKIQKIVTPAGITAWLVEEHTVPLVALNYAFRGGSSQDAADKAGTANLAADLLDEGAGNLDSAQFHDRLERHAIDLGFDVGRDYFRGTLRTLSEHRNEAFDLLHMALSEPHFSAEAVQRVRGQVMAGLRREVTNPNDVASLRWWQTAFPGHPYGRQSSGSLETVPRITADDLRNYVRRVFARDQLTVSIV
ncbi:MAG TPA: pitrilysin family protein, partial [Pseudolabrys sp.]|nr:pitrilysin family protein [Pseudolabrys sp.]